MAHLFCTGLQKMAWVFADIACDVLYRMVKMVWKIKMAWNILYKVENGMGCFL